jgi:hypothetical protein
VGCCYAEGAFSFWSVLGLFLVTTTMGWYFLWGPFRGFISLLDSGVVTGREVNLWRVKLQAGQLLRVSKFFESEMATKDTHLVL